MTVNSKKQAEKPCPCSTRAAPAAEQLDCTHTQPTARGEWRRVVRLPRPMVKCHHAAWGSSCLAAGPAAVTHPGTAPRMQQMLSARRIEPVRLQHIVMIHCVLASFRKL